MQNSFMLLPLFLNTRCGIGTTGPPLHLLSSKCHSSEFNSASAALRRILRVGLAFKQQLFGNRFCQFQINILRTLKK